MSRLGLLMSFCILAACASPQERCVSQATKVYRDALSEQKALSATLARGYAIEKRRVPYQRFVICETSKGKTYPCWKTYYRWVDRKVQVDLTAVRARYSDLNARLPALERAANDGAAQCRATVPAG